MKYARRDKKRSRVGSSVWSLGQCTGRKVVVLLDLDAEVSDLLVLRMRVLVSFRMRDDEFRDLADRVEHNGSPWRVIGVTITREICANYIAFLPGSMISSVSIERTTAFIRLR